MDKVLLFIGFILNTNGTTSVGCTDQTNNCQFLNDTIQICDDVGKARDICKKYCGLCSIVDGHWSIWKTWGGCDVTCGKGIKSRSRTFDNPRPAGGGIDCVGNSAETDVCSLETCPVHGGWSGWSEWGTCSSSCGAGLQRRDRSCDNPWPSKDGNTCYGDSVDNRICQEMACAVAFQAHGPKNLRPTTGETMIYETIDVNLGNAYSSTTGYFTAPFNGVYVFVVQMCMIGGYAELVLVKNGLTGEFQRLFNYDTSHGDYAGSSSQAYIQLVKDDHVYVVCQYSRGLILQEDSFTYNSFGGSIVTLV